MSVWLLLKVTVAAPAAGTRSADSGSILLAEFLKDLGRSSCIQKKKNNSRFWFASLDSWYLQLLGGYAVLCCGLGVLWSFQVVPTLSYLGTSYPPSSTALAAAPAAPTAWEGFVPASEPVARKVGRVQGSRGLGVLPTKQA